MTTLYLVTSDILDESGRQEEANSLRQTDLVPKAINNGTHISKPIKIL